MHRGLSALTARALVGNEGPEIFETEETIASLTTQYTDLSANELLTKKDAIFQNLALKFDVNVVKKLKDMITYLELHPQTKTNTFGQVVDLLQQLDQEKVQNINEQAKTM